MKNDIKEISYNLTKSQEKALYKEKSQENEKRLKRDIKNIFFRRFGKYNKFYDILQNKEDIIEDTFLELRQLYDEIGTKKHDYTTNKTIMQIKRQYRYELIEDMAIYELLEENFYKHYSAYKKENNEELKQKDKLIEDNKKANINAIKKKLFDIYNELNDDNCSKNAIEYGISNNIDGIFEELEIEKNDEYVMIFYKELKKLKNTIPTKYIKPQPKQEKLSLGWKLYFGLKAIDKLSKH